MKKQPSEINLNYIPRVEFPKKMKNKCLCSSKQIALIIIPILAIALYLAIFLPIYLKSRDDRFKVIIIENNTSYKNIKINDEFEEYIANYSYSKLTPKNGYNNIYIHLNDINETSEKYFEFFKSNLSFIPQETKIIFLSGKYRKIKLMDKYNYNNPVPSWFNIDINGKLICDDCNNIFNEVKESLNIILDLIDRIAREENMSYNKIYLGGYSQGAIMVNYVLLNSRYELGGYIAFSGYILEYNFQNNTVISKLTDEQKIILNSKKNYNIIATHSFNDQEINYDRIIKGYSIYYKNFPNFYLYSFGSLNHEFVNQPVFPIIKKWLKEKMGK